MRREGVVGSLEKCGGASDLIAAEKPGSRAIRGICWRRTFVGNDPGKGFLGKERGRGFQVTDFKG